MYLLFKQERTEIFMKKILIFYASYGGGHLSAAKSIKQYIDENYHCYFEKK